MAGYNGKTKKQKGLIMKREKDIWKKLISEINSLLEEKGDNYPKMDILKIKTELLQAIALMHIAQALDNINKKQI